MLLVYALSLSLTWVDVVLAKQEDRDGFPEFRQMRPVK